MNGPQVEIRRFYKGQPATGLLYGEALGTDWLSSQQKIERDIRYFVNEGWNKLRIVADGSAHSDVGERTARRRHRQRGRLQDAPARVHRPADPRL